MTYNSSWTIQKKLRSALWKHEAFRGKAFPASVSDRAWEAGLDSKVLLFDQHVVFSASVEFTNTKGDPLLLTLQPLKVEQSHRLGRRYGSDRFMELLIPSPDSFNLPQYLKHDESFFETLIQWLTREPHALCGRWWRPFYTKDGGSREPVKDLSFGPDKMKIYQNRIYFFAERGINLPELPLQSMLHWLLDFRQASNKRQPVLKLFQRIAIGKAALSHDQGPYLITMYYSPQHHQPYGRLRTIPNEAPIERSHVSSREGHERRRRKNVPSSSQTDPRSPWSAYLSERRARSLGERQGHVNNRRHGCIR